MDTSFITINTHSSIRLETKEGKVIDVDPYDFKTEPHDADLILVTHTHFDHFSPEDIARVRKPHTAFVMPATGKGEFAKAGNNANMQGPLIITGIMLHLQLKMIDIGYYFLGAAVKFFTSWS